MANYKDEMIQVGPTKVRVLSGGEGEPLLFLHGAGGAGIWLPFMEQLAQHYRIIVPDHPGFGLSDDPEWLEGMSDWVLFYLDFLDELGLDKVHLVGLSLGGWLAAELAVGHRERLLSLTLVDAAGIYVPGVKTEDMFMWNREEMFRNLFVNQEMAEERIRMQLTPEQNEIIVKNSETTAKIAWNPRLFNPRLEKWLHRINVPTLIVWGDHDCLFPIEYAHTYQRLISGSQLAVIPECGHMPNVEKPGEFVQALLRFYDK